MFCVFLSLSASPKPSQQKAKRAQACLQLGMELNMQSGLPAATTLENSRPEFAQALAGRSGRGWAQPSSVLLHPLPQVLLLGRSGPLDVGTGATGAPLRYVSGRYLRCDPSLWFGSWRRRKQCWSSSLTSLRLLRPGLVNRVPNHLAGHGAVRSNDRDSMVVGGVRDPGK